MGESRDERLLSLALELEIITEDQRSEASWALEMVRQAGVRTSAAVILLDKGFATSSEIGSVEEELMRREEGGAGDAPSATDEVEIDASALHALAADEAASGAEPQARGAQPERLPAEEETRAEASDDYSADALSEGLETEGPALRGRRRSSPALKKVLKIAAWVGPIVAVVAVVAGAMLAIRSCIADRAREGLARAREAYENNQPRHAIAIYDSVSKAFGEASRQAEVASARISKELFEAKKLYREGRRLLGAKKRAAAMKAFTAVIEKYPRSGEWVHYAKADMARCRGQIFREWMAKARAAEAGLRWREAEAFYRQAAPYEVGGKDALNKMAGAAKKAGSYEAAMARGRRALKLKRSRDAADAFRRALLATPGDHAAYESLGRALSGIPPPKGMELIRPGLRKVGSDSGEPDEGKAREVFFTGCYLDRTEVTNQEYAKFVREMRYPAPPHWPAGRIPAGREKEPVVCVTWEGAAAYAKWRVKRLPSSLEWETAARGPSGRAYPWGDVFRASNANFGLGPMQVGANPMDRSPEGAMDMAGNVSEWVRDLYPGPRGAGRRAEEGEATKPAPRRVIRGNSWVGTERGRPTRALPGGTLSSARPDRVILQDDPGDWALPILYPARRSFVFASYSLNKPTFRCYAWVEQLGQWGKRSQAFLKEERVYFRYPVRRGRRRAAVDFDTGLQLMEVTGQGAGRRVTLRSESGAVRTMSISKEPPFGPLPESAAPRAADSQAPLKRAARSCNVYCASQDQRFLNVGFRCAKDIVSGKRK